MTHRTLHRRASLPDVQRWLDAGVLPPAETLRAREFLNAGPTSRSAWRFVVRRAVWIGSLLLAAALVFFIASQWGGMSLYERMSLTLGVTAAATAVAFWLRVDTVAGQAAVTLAALSFGPVMAVYGQAFQTGESWDLFGRWCLVAAAFAWAARSSACRVLAVCLGWLTWILLWPHLPAAPDGFFSSESWPASLAVVVAGSLLAYAWRHLGLDDWSVRAPIVLALGSSTATAFEALADGDFLGPGSPPWIAAALGVGVILAVLWIFRRGEGDPVLVTTGLAALGVLASTAWGRLLFDSVDDELALLALGLGICVLSGLGTWWFRRWHAGRGEHAERSDGEATS